MPRWQTENLVRELDEPALTLSREGEGDDRYNPDKTWTIDVYEIGAIRFVHVNRGDDIHFGFIEGATVNVRDDNVPDRSVSDMLAPFREQADEEEGKSRLL